MSDAKTILVVEDEPDTLLALKDRLEMEGYRVVTAVDGMEALEVLPEARPALILMDVMMPRMNGYQLCRKIKSREEWSRIPVILVTAKSQESDRYWGKESGCDDYVTKPFEMDDVIERIREKIRSHPQGF